VEATYPFFDTVRLLYSSRGKLPTDMPAKQMIIEAYLQEWLEYGSYEELSNTFAAMDGLLAFYMAYVKYIRARNLHLAWAEKPETTPDDGAGLNTRYETTAIYLKEFIESRAIICY